MNLGLISVSGGEGETDRQSRAYWRSSQPPLLQLDTSRGKGRGGPFLTEGESGGGTQKLAKGNYPKCSVLFPPRCPPHPHVLLLLDVSKLRGSQGITQQKVKSEQSGIVKNSQNYPFSSDRLQL